jgi:hypothetical protein
LFHIQFYRIALGLAKLVCEKYYKNTTGSVYSPQSYLLQSTNVMADLPTTTPGSRTAPTKGVAASILLDMADTTWRLFIPTIGLLLVGRHFDVRFDTKPWLMLAGVAVGAVIAMFLIKNQLKRGGATT